MPDYIPKPDRACQAFVERVTAAIEAAPGDFGLTAADATALRGKQTTYSDALDGTDAAQAAARVAVTAQDKARMDLEAFLRPLIQRAQLNPVVTDATKVAAGIPIRDKIRTSTAPIPPLALVATPAANGTCGLKWGANGNASGIQYVVERKQAPATEFTTVDVVPATSWKDSAAPAGTHCEYRIRARRGGVTSEPSNVAPIY